MSHVIRKISFANYKIFKSWQQLELRPITVLIGKNSAGKSALAKLPLFLSDALNGISRDAISLELDKVELGAEFRDLLYGRSMTGSLQLAIQNEEEKLNVEIAAEATLDAIPEILWWRWFDGQVEIQKGRDEVYKGLTWQDQNLKTFPKDLAFSVDYLGPIRSIPTRIFSPEKSRRIEKVGSRGEHAYPLLYQSQLQPQATLVEQVNEWYQQNFEGWGIRINRDRDPYYEVELSWKDRFHINLCDVGEGMSQVLPVIVRAFMPSDENTIISIEQPELHLHPAAHGSLAQLFAERAKVGAGTYLIETHSKNFVLRLRRLVAEGLLLPEKIILYYVDFDEENGESNLRAIEVDDLGKVNFWPEHVFSESLDEAIALRTAQLNQQGHVD